ncbi:MAG: hypothetical protein KF764_10165 [Labilithrix sp.]|nr:hypothetical protein [Labilithrix sp.]
MKRKRTVLAGGLFAAVVVVLGLGCQEPTQVTLELSLDKKARCAEIAAGTAISVGVEPLDTEARVASGFVTARTTTCDEATGSIGTLVVTPTDPGRASVIVVVGYGGKDPTSCKPPRYEGCIVARRRFAFVEHARLRMPIAIDPDCADVPCDAFSTCSKGICFDSETACSGGDCGRPGELPDGGFDEGGAVIPDAGPLPDDDSGTLDGGDGGPLTDGAVDGGDGGPKDGGIDGGDGGLQPVNAAYCPTGSMGPLYCPKTPGGMAEPCEGGKVCCSSVGGPLCIGMANCGSEMQYCCGQSHCGSGICPLIPGNNASPASTCAGGI